MKYLNSNAGKPWSTAINKIRYSKLANESMPTMMVANNKQGSGLISKGISNYHSSEGFYSEWDEFFLSVCDICGFIIKPQALEKHLITRHQIESQSKKIPQMEPNETENNSEVVLTTVSALTSTKAHVTPAITIRTSTTITATSPTNTIPMESIITPKVTNSNLTQSNGKILSRKANSLQVLPDQVSRSDDSTCYPKSEPAVKKSMSFSERKDLKKRRQQQLQNSKAKEKSQNNRQTKPSPISESIPQLDEQIQDKFFIDAKFYGLQPLSPPAFSKRAPSSISKSSAVTLPGSKYSRGSASPSPSSVNSLNSSSPSSTSASITSSNSQSQQQLVILPMISLFSQNRLAHTNPLGQVRYQSNRRWRKTYSVLRDAFS